jgi:electron transfer flavoprotein beta subunit
VKILVPVKRVADPNNANKMKVSPDGKQVVSGDLPWAINPFDEYALEAALRLLENGATGERTGELVIVSLGVDDVQTTMRQALAMGADRGIHLKADEGALDSLVVAKALKAVVDAEKPDLVLMGKQAVDGDSNTAGQMLAELLGWPMATFAMSIARDGNTLVVGREVDTGVLTLKVTLPAVVTVDLRIVQSKAVTNGKSRRPRTRIRTTSATSREGDHGGEEEAPRLEVARRHRRHADDDGELQQVRAARRALGQHAVRRVGRGAREAPPDRGEGHLSTALLNTTLGG